MTILDNESLRSKLMDQFHIDNYFESLTHLKFDLVNFSKDELIIKEGSPIDCIYFILIGKVKRYSCGAHDFDISYMTKGLIGDVEFVSSQPATHNVLATSDTLAICLNVKGCRHRLMSDRNFLRYLTAQLAEKVLLSGTTTENTPELTTEERLFEYLKLSEDENGLITQSLREIAPIMGVSYRHLIRMMNSLCDDGRIRHGNAKGRYYIAH